MLCVVHLLYHALLHLIWLNTISLQRFLGLVASTSEPGPPDDQCQGQHSERTIDKWPGNIIKQSRYNNQPDPDLHVFHLSWLCSVSRILCLMSSTRSFMASLSCARRCRKLVSEDIFCLSCIL